jgi:hypothetical protein
MADALSGLAGTIRAGEGRFDCYQGRMDIHAWCVGVASLLLQGRDDGVTE